MDVVTVSPKYQIVIPQPVRDSLGIKPGQKLHVFCVDGIIEIVPVKPIRSMRGFLKGIDTSVPREPDRL